MQSISCVIGGERLYPDNL